VRAAAPTTTRRSTTVQRAAEAPKAATKTTTARKTTEQPKAASAASYGSCAKAKAAGAAPLHVGEPGYSRKLDRDGDGVACET